MTVKTASTTEDVKQCFSQAAEKIDAIFTINTQDQYYKCIRPAQKYGQNLDFYFTEYWSELSWPFTLLDKKSNSSSF